jgi:ribosome maturation factor RimP
MPNGPDAILNPQLSCRREGVGSRIREWAPARSFYVKSESMTASQTDIERRLAQVEPDVEVLLVEVLGGKCLRVFIDHPDGVTLAMCERVTLRLNDLREFYALEVSSPGSQRPLTKPAHFRRFLGHRARVRTHRPRPIYGQDANPSPANRRSPDPKDLAAAPVATQPRGRGRARGPRGQSSALAARAATSSFTGELVAASEEEVTLAAASGVIAIPYSEIRRSNLLED